MRKNLLLATLLAFLGSCQSLYTDRSASASAKYDAGLSAYENGDFRSALEIWRPIAEQGHAEAQLGVGTIYDIQYHKIEPERDWDAAKERAYRWYLKAAEQGNTEAEGVVAVLLEVGSGVEKDVARAAIWYRKAAEKGDAEAQYGLGMLYFEGRGVEQNRAEAFRWMTLAAAGGNAMAQFHVAGSYECGDGTATDLAQAKLWYQKAADQGDSAARRRVELLSSNIVDDFCD